MPEYRASRIKADRRALLTYLNMVYPRWVPGEELFLIRLDDNPEYSRTLLVRDMDYLSERGYIAFKSVSGRDVRNNSCKDCKFKITANGTDFANKIMEDPRLEI